MNSMPILTYLIFLPLLGSILIYLVNAFNKKLNTAVYVAISAIQLLLGIFMWSGFDPKNPNFQFEEKFIWFEKWNVYYSLGIDSFSLYFILLTIFLIPICIYVGLRSAKENKTLFISLFLILESCVVGVFSAKDLILFYVFFEAFLIPMYLIIGIWGSKNRVYASIKFFIYTLFGSILMLLAISYIFINVPTTDISELSKYLRDYPLDIQKLLWIAFFVSFAIKIPLWPFHTWLPDAHVEAPTSGSIILAGVLLKVGGYGLLRFNLPMFPDASIYFAEYVWWLSIIAVIYTSIVALMQTNMKKMIAYSSVAHMGYVVAGIFTFSQIGIQGAVFQMISHGLVSSALFLCVGILYEQTHTKEIEHYQGLAQRMPNFSLLFTVFVMASIGLPITSGFIGEFLVLLGAFEVKTLYGVLLALGMVLGASYMLWLYIRIIFGDQEKVFKILRDIKTSNSIILTLIAIMVIFIGIYPKIINDYSLKNSVNLAHSMNLSEVTKLNNGL
ncbi:MAG: NADH-quinone oxidoreductase subunit M [Candidatus Midichloriaceae bacterium]